MSDNAWALKCLICGFSRCSLVPMQEHAMHTHCRTRDDLRGARRRDVPGGYVWTFPDGVDWLGAQKANVIVRGWSGSVLQFEEGLNMDEPSNLSPAQIYAMVERHVSALGPLHGIEFEFPELPEAERFFRFGTDPTGMVKPAVVDSENSENYCPRCGSAALEMVTDTRAADRRICGSCGLVFLPEKWLREFYKGFEK